MHYLTSCPTKTIGQLKSTDTLLIQQKEFCKQLLKLKWYHSDLKNEQNNLIYNFLISKLLLIQLTSNWTLCYTIQEEFVLVISNLCLKFPITLRIAWDEVHYYITNYTTILWLSMQVGIMQSSKLINNWCLTPL